MDQPPRARAGTAEEAERLRERVTDWLLESAMGYTERFELGAERFYNATGFLAPGKSEPLEMHGGEARQQRRQAVWDNWQAHQKATYQQDLRAIRDLLTERADLLAALKGLHEFTVVGVGECDGSCEPGCVFCVASAAIDRAEGRAGR